MGTKYPLRHTERMPPHHAYELPSKLSCSQSIATQHTRDQELDPVYRTRRDLRRELCSLNYMFYLRT